MKNEKQGEQNLELIDGMGVQPAIMRKPSPLNVPQCAPGRHCAHHGGDPIFVCCRCGAEFLAK